MTEAPLDKNSLEQARDLLRTPCNLCNKRAGFRCPASALMAAGLDPKDTPGILAQLAPYGKFAVWNRDVPIEDAEAAFDSLIAKQNDP